MTHHRRGLRRLLRDDELADAIELQLNQAPELDPRRKAMLTYALKLTRTPADMVQADVDALRANGFSDLDILHIAETTAYYAYVNRIADGLGVDVETD